MTPIEPLTIELQGEHGWTLARTAVIVAVLTSAPWAWMLHDQREQADKLLADATARSARVERLMITYSSGAKAFVEIKAQP